MQLSYIKVPVAENTEIAKGIYRLFIKGSFVGRPGQFYMLRSMALEPFLSRPISINDITEEGIFFLYEVKGKGTTQLSRIKTDEYIQLLGPLGNGFNIDDINGRVAIVSGGIGIAPMKYTAKSLNNCQIDLYSGFRDEVYIIEEFTDYVDKINIATDSGSYGHKGVIVDLFEPSSYDLVLTCGPKPMMKKVIEICDKAKVPVLVSMESHMACGIGACLGCTCKTKDGNKRTCKEGPVFSGKEVVMDA